MRTLNTSFKRCCFTESVNVPIVPTLYRDFHKCKCKGKQFFYQYFYIMMFVSIVSIQYLDLPLRGNPQNLFATNLYVNASRDQKYYE